MDELLVSVILVAGYYIERWRTAIEGSHDHFVSVNQVAEVDCLPMVRSSNPNWFGLLDHEGTDQRNSTEKTGRSG